MSKSIVCTLYEGHYHFGVAALINSLHANGFEGDIYIGYKNTFPPWAKTTKASDCLDWHNAGLMHIADKIRAVFLPLSTSYHLTHYKPYFILDLLKKLNETPDTLFYFDPDIVVKADWKFFVQWAGYGVAVVHEILYNDMPPTHPTRYAWKNLINSTGKTVVRELFSYVNGGFLGLHIKHKVFLDNWKEFMDLIVENYKVDLSQWHTTNKLDPYCLPDQDLLNAALMCYPGNISEMGPDAMDFSNGGYIMSHATDKPKPWKKKYILNALKGIRPTMAEKNFWNYIDGRLKICSIPYIKRKRLSILIASFIGRFYSRK